ncbi:MULTISPECIES: cupin domain-containing protein [Dyella]|uniref:Cupin domain-containing protein n=2 Tax=Dyella TaxID=231454 RepID=A0A4R0YKP3_9GAMM|nr:MULTISPECIES: cupin domain-containing protein [Dyella]TBR36212.1 cupin domain-containing protein [Dyella terrae]TCI05869.1 cupin domain-containing protein [Dyella soli]
MPRLIPTCLPLLFLGATMPLLAGEAVSETLLRSSAAWDGTAYASYPSGSPQVSVLKITLPPHTILPWHRHPVINVAYVTDGSLHVERRDNGQTRVVRAGDVLPELVDVVHRGYTKEQPTSLIVFYAGAEGWPIAVPDAPP